MNSYEFKFKKMYGQNFLKEEGIVKKIVDVATVEKDSLVIEIGPGSGMLTKEIAKVAKNVLCYEIDYRLEEILDKELVLYSNIDIIYDDFLKRNIKEDIKDYSYQHLYVIANLPYYITTPIITKLIEETVEVDTIVVMVQKEVGERFSAKVGTKDYNSLTVFLNYYFTIKKEFIVNRNCFIPKPNVDSVVVSLKRKANTLEVEDLPFFFKLVRMSFRFKRKNLRNNLKDYDLALIAEALEIKGKDITMRAEQLSLEDFVFLSNYYAVHKALK